MSFIVTYNPVVHTSFKVKYGVSILTIKSYFHSLLPIYYKEDISCFMCLQINYRLL